MTREDAVALTGKKIAVGSTVHVITRYDPSRRQFVTRNTTTGAEGPIAIQTFVDAVSDGIIRLVKGRRDA